MPQYPDVFKDYDLASAYAFLDKWTIQDKNSIQSYLIRTSFYEDLRVQTQISISALGIMSRY